MKNIKILLIAALSMIVLNTHAQMLSNGVSKELADHRKANISNVVYDLTFYIPSDLDKRVTGKAFISFDLQTLEDVVFDFQGDFNGSALVGKNDIFFLVEVKSDDGFADNGFLSIGRNVESQVVFDVANQRLAVFSKCFRHTFFKALCI